MSEGNGASGVNALAIVAILVIVLLAGYFAYNSGMLGGGEKSGPKVEINLPAAPAKNP